LVGSGKPVESIAAPRSCSTFQELILKLQSYWGGKGCALLQPYDWKWRRVRSIPRRSCARSAPTLGARLRAALAAAKDGRYGDNPNRLQHYYQYQVV